MHISGNLRAFRDFRVWNSYTFHDTKGLDFVVPKNLAHSEEEANKLVSVRSYDQLSGTSISSLVHPAHCIHSNSGSLEGLNVGLFDI